MRVTVFTGSSSGTSPVYTDAVARLGRELAEARVGIVYGGAHVGLMGAIADAALESGGEVIGVIPRFLVNREVAHPGLTRLDVVESMHERKLRMAELGDASLALPGGLGTLEEFFEAWTWQVLGLHRRPAMLFDVRDYWTPLRSLLDHMVESGFVARPVYEALSTVTDAQGVVDVIAQSRGG